MKWSKKEPLQKVILSSVEETERLAIDNTEKWKTCCLFACSYLYRYYAMKKTVVSCHEFNLKDVSLKK